MSTETKEIIESLRSDEVIASLYEKVASLDKEIEEKDKLAVELYEDIRQTSMSPIERTIRTGLVGWMLERSIREVFGYDIYQIHRKTADPTIEDLTDEKKRIQRAISYLEGKPQSDQNVEDLKMKVDISEVAEKYVKVERQSGIKSYVCCPFHDEDTPSMVLYSDNNTFNCFGCNRKGDIIEFIMGVEKVKFPEALEVLKNL